MFCQVQMKRLRHFSYVKQRPKKIDLLLERAFMGQKRSISGIIQQQNAEAARERERDADEASRERLARVAAGVAGVAAGVSLGAGYLSGRPSSQHGDSRYYTLGDPVGGVSDISERPKSVMYISRKSIPTVYLRRL